MSYEFEFMLESEGHPSEAAAKARIAELAKRNPNANHSTRQSRRTGKWHIFRNSTGGSHLVESFEEFLSEAIRVEGHDHYKFTHGKRPSGQGNWMIGVGHKNIDHSKHKEGEHFVTHNGHLSDALKKAKALAKEKGHTSVHILT